MNRLPLAVAHLLQAARPFADEYIAPDLSCHRGYADMAHCGRCGRILRLREAIEEVEAAMAAVPEKAEGV